jgi:hypothetical protein
VQIGPVDGPPRRSADRTPKPPPVADDKNLQVARSTRAANTRNLTVVQVLVIGYCQTRSQFQVYLAISRLDRYGANDHVRAESE